MGSNSNGEGSATRGDDSDVGRYGQEAMNAMAAGLGVTDSQGNPVGHGPNNSGGVTYGGTHATQQAAADAAAMQGLHGNVSPAQSMAMVGDASLAGLSQANAVNSFGNPVSGPHPGSFTEFGYTPGFDPVAGLLASQQANQPDWSGSPYSSSYSYSVDPLESGLPSLFSSMPSWGELGEEMAPFAFDPMLGIVSGMTGVPIGMVLGIAHAMGAEIGPSDPGDPDRGRSDEYLPAGGYDADKTNQEYLDSITDPDQLRIIELMEQQDYTLQEIRDYLDDYIEVV